MDPRTEEPPIDDEAILRVDDDRFDGGVCLVTGAASGIGRATAIAAAANGLTVAATDMDERGLRATIDRVDTLEDAGPIESIVGDLTKDADLDAIVEAAAALGPVRYLANIAGVQHVAPLERFPMDVFDTMQDVMVRAPMYLTKACFPHMRDAGGGAVGNMASVHGHIVTTDKVAYNTAKFALRGLTQSIAAEGDGIVRGFSVSTGYVQTPLVTGQLETTAERRGLTVDEVIEDVMLGRSRVKEMMTPLDVANLFIFGFSDHARHLNGDDLLFDGGMVRTYG